MKVVILGKVDDVAKPEVNTALPKEHACINMLSHVTRGKNLLAAHDSCEHVTGYLCKQQYAANSGFVTMLLFLVIGGPYLFFSFNGSTTPSFSVLRYRVSEVDSVVPTYFFHLWVYFPIFFSSEHVPLFQACLLPPLCAEQSFRLSPFCV